jgi:hypothetical protein
MNMTPFEIEIQPNAPFIGHFTSAEAAMTACYAQARAEARKTGALNLFICPSRYATTEALRQARAQQEEEKEGGAA